MAKFTLAAAPVFKHVIIVPVAGNPEGLELELTFKHHSLKDLQDQEKISREAQEACRKADDRDGEYVAMAEFIMFLAKGWELEQDFSAENIIVACSRYPRFFEAVVSGYTKELFCLREKR